jgi:hypothetical protein
MADGQDLDNFSELKEKFPSSFSKSESSDNPLSGQGSPVAEAHGSAPGEAAPASPGPEVSQQPGSEPVPQADEGSEPVPQADEGSEPIPQGDEGAEPIPQGDEGAEPVPQGDEGAESGSDSDNPYNYYASDLSSGPGLMDENPFTKLYIQLEEALNKAKELESENTNNERLIHHMQRLYGEEVVCRDFSEIPTPEGNEDYSLGISDRLKEVDRALEKEAQENQAKENQAQAQEKEAQENDAESPNHEENIYDAESPNHEENSTDSPQDLTRSSGEASSNVHKRSLNSDIEGNNNKRRKF